MISDWNMVPGTQENRERGLRGHPMPTRYRDTVTCFTPVKVLPWLLSMPCSKSLRAPPAYATNAKLPETTSNLVFPHFPPCTLWHIAQNHDGLCWVSSDRLYHGQCFARQIVTIIEGRAESDNLCGNTLPSNGSHTFSLSQKGHSSWSSPTHPSGSAQMPAPCRVPLLPLVFPSEKALPSPIIFTS